MNYEESISENRGRSDVPEWCENSRCHVDLKCMESEEIELCGHDNRWMLFRVMKHNKDMSLESAKAHVRKYSKREIYFTNDCMPKGA